MQRIDGGLDWHRDISDHYSDAGSRLNWQIIWIFGVTVHTARIIFLPVSRVSIYGSLSVDCCLSLSSTSPPVPRVVLCQTLVVLASPPALRCHVFTAPSPGVTDITDPSLSSPTRTARMYHTGLILAGGSNFAVVTKKVSYERDDRAWDSQTIRDYQLSFVLAPAANTHSPHTRSFTKVSAIHILLLIKIGRQRQDNALSLTVRRT